jgi:hypothetical protein
MVNHRMIPRFFVIVVVLALLAACGGQAAAPEEETAASAEETAAPAEEAAEESTEQPAEETAEPSEEPLEEAALPEGMEMMGGGMLTLVGQTPQEAVLNNLMSFAGDADIVSATIYLMLTESYADGDGIVFHFEDARSGASVGCSGYGLAVETAEGWSILEMDIRCGNPTGPGTSLSAFLSDIPDRMTVFGEIYDAAVADVVVVVDGEEIAPALGGGAYLARLTGMTPESVVVQALDADGAVIYEETLLPSEGS